PNPCGSPGSAGARLMYRAEGDRDFLRSLPYTGRPDVLVDRIFKPGVAGQLERKNEADFRLYRPGADACCLTLDPDRACTSVEQPFTPDGRFLAWGCTDGAVVVADLPAIRDRLVAAGFPGW